jgi:hypothetical protein
MAFGMNFDGIGEQIGNLTKDGLERLNENLDKLATEQRRQNDISTVEMGLTMFADEESQKRAKEILKVMLDDLEYKYL